MPKLTFFTFFLLLGLTETAVPPGGAPFVAAQMEQPVSGAVRFPNAKICNVTEFGAKGDNSTNNTIPIQAAIDACGDRLEGGIVVVGGEGGGGEIYLTNPLWLRSNMTLRIDKLATLQAFPAGGNKADEPLSWPRVYTKRESTMKWAYSGFLNGARCTSMKQPLVGWDDCATWDKLKNIVIEGGGTIDGNGDKWLESDQGNLRPVMLDLLWIDGLTLQGVKLRRPGFWTSMPAFCNNVRIEGLDIYTTGHNTDGLDPDSTWNVYIFNNTIDTGDDCVAIKAGRDWSGRMVNISTTNVLIEENHFKAGHGVSIGSETSGWIQNVIVRNSNMSGTDRAVRIKSERGRGGGARNVTYSSMSGDVDEAISLTLKYEDDILPTNNTATPEIHDLFISGLDLTAEKTYMTCEGLPESIISGVAMANVKVDGEGSSSLGCSFCSGTTAGDISPDPCFDME